MLLAIDTATWNAGVALYRDDGVHAEVTWRSRRNHTVELMSQVVRVLQLARLEKNELEAVAVALGPGSFTGLRVGMSVGKGIAYARALPIFGIPTLDIIAHAFANHDLPIFAILAAGRGRYSVASYAAQDGKAERAGASALVTTPEIVGWISQRMPSGRALFCGEMEIALQESIAEGLGKRALIATPAQTHRRAGFLAELAWARYLGGATDDTASLAPTYA